MKKKVLDILRKRRDFFNSKIGHTFARNKVAEAIKIINEYVPPSEFDELSNQLEHLVIKNLRNVRDDLVKARNEKCVCSGFTLQYEQGCQCDKEKKVTACEKALWDIVNSL